VTCALAGILIATASPSTASAQTPKALVGTWKLNPARSKYNPGPAPKTMTVVYALTGESLKITVDLVPATGAAQKWETTAGFDGKPHPITGHPTADTITLARINDTTGESTFMKGGKVTAVSRRVLSADGKTLTISTKGKTEDGKPRNDVAVFDKQTGA
jgi:hypothetical protein